MITGLHVPKCLDPPTFWALLALHIYVKQFEPSSSHIRESIATVKCP